VGINLGDLVVKHETAWQDLAGQRVAIDAYNTLYQFLATIRGPDGTPLRDAQGRVTSHLSGLLQRTGHMVAGGIQPVYVFDGAPHPLKRATLDQRREVKQKAQRAYEQAVAAGDMETARAKAQQTSTLDKTMVAQAKELLDALGVPWIDAPGEGEAQAAAMTRQGAVDATASQDYDSVLFGAPVLYRNLSIGGRRKVAGKQAWVDVAPERIDLDETLEALGLTRAQLVDVALLVGTDYNPGVKGVGPKTALKIVREAGSLEQVLATADEGKAKGAVWTKVRDGREGLEPMAELRTIFLTPEVDPVETLHWPGAQADRVRSLLVDDFRFSRQRVDSALEKFVTGRAERAQSSLGDF
jgi:flap endonuclease-1